MPANPFFVTNCIAGAIALTLAWSLFTARRKDNDFKPFLQDECLSNINPASYVVGGLVLVVGVLLLMGFPLVSQGTMIFSLAMAFGLFVHGLVRGLNVSSLGRCSAMFAFMLMAAPMCPEASIALFSLGAMFGLSWGKLIELRLTILPNPVQEVAAACLWLAGLLIAVPGKANNVISHQSELLAIAICISFVVRIVQPPFLKVDHLFVKRIALAATGGMLMLVALVRYFHSDATALAWVYGLGLFVAYVAEQIDVATQKDNEKVRAIMRTLLIAAASLALVMFQLFAAKSDLSIPLFFAASLLLAETSQTAYLLCFYAIATTIFTGVPSEFWSSTLAAEAHNVSMYPFVGGAITIGSLACATYFSLCLPEARRSSFDWAEPLIFVCLLAFGLAILMVSSWAPAVGAMYLDIALALSVWHEVFFAKQANARSQCLLFSLMLMCLVYVFSLPAGALLPFAAMSAIFRPREKAQEPAPV